MIEPQSQNVGAKGLAAVSTWKPACLCAVTDGVPRTMLLSALRAHGGIGSAA